MKKVILNEPVREISINDVPDGTTLLLKKNGVIIGMIIQSDGMFTHATSKSLSNKRFNMIKDVIAYVVGLGFEVWIE